MRKQEGEKVKARGRGGEGGGGSGGPTLGSRRASADAAAPRATPSESRHRPSTRRRECSNHRSQPACPSRSGPSTGENARGRGRAMQGPRGPGLGGSGRGWNLPGRASRCVVIYDPGDSDTLSSFNHRRFKFVPLRIQSHCQAESEAMMASRPSSSTSASGRPRDGCASCAGSGPGLQAPGGSDRGELDSERRKWDSGPVTVRPESFKTLSYSTPWP